MSISVTPAKAGVALIGAPRRNAAAPACAGATRA
ncbi:hypothetical protein ACVWYO_001933 [Sphingomonas sp. UYP23]